MDWDAMIDNLRSQVNFYAKQANEQRAGFHVRASELRACADFASVLLSALYAGREAAKKSAGTP